jgi:hypothetical protein
MNNKKQTTTKNYKKVASTYKGEVIFFEKPENTTNVKIKKSKVNYSGESIELLQRVVEKKAYQQALLKEKESKLRELKRFRYVAHKFLDCLIFNSSNVYEKMSLKY